MPETAPMDDKIEKFETEPYLEHCTDRIEEEAASGNE
jgi:hypothetical protein